MSVINDTAPLALPAVAETSTEIRALRKACGELERWLSGKAEIPREILLRVVDVLLDELAPPTDGDDDDPPAPRFSAPSARRDHD